MVGTLFGSFLILLVFGVPIAVAIGLGAMVPMLMQGNVPLTLVISRMFGGIDSFPLMAIPFFVLTGTLATSCSLTDKVVGLAAYLVGQMRAGLAHCNIVAAMLFGGITGSAVAESAALGSILIPGMTSKKYPPSYAAAITSTASVIGSIIPPSTLMIIYGYLTGVSTGRLFLGGAIPGLLVGLGLMLTAHIQAVRLGIGVDPDLEKRSLAGFTRVFRECGPALLIPLIILGGIVGGVFTPTEAGVVAVVVVLLLGQLVYGGFGLRSLRRAFLEAGYTTAMVFLILGASTVFANMLTRARFQSTLISLLESVSGVPEIQMMLILLSLICLGLFIDATAVLIMFAAPLAAVCAGIGYDPVHSGVAIVIACLIGGVTPPVGTLLFIAAGIARISITEASKGVLPFVLMLMLINVVIALIPALVLFLPNLLF
ncbi:TRAP transporter large permease [Tropicimonas sp. IMCC34011]|uniref:TRAP transporter large permease n=1 Tax=Tropicimonas sp. IMCC34011 TaxID=2248759 RepID=UPI000E22C7D5|nr:TRAP transporter large permease [Tropicimonas sp. IMCC34011]